MGDFVVIWVCVRFGGVVVGAVMDYPDIVPMRLVGLYSAPLPNGRLLGFLLLIGWKTASGICPHPPQKKGFYYINTGGWGHKQNYLPTKQTHCCDVVSRCPHPSGCEVSPPPSLLAAIGKMSKTGGWGQRPAKKNAGANRGSWQRGQQITNKLRRNNN